MDIYYWQKDFEDYWSSKELDASHDLGHFRRVWTNAKEIADEEDDELVILAACYFHDLISYPKNDDRRALASTHSAEKAKEILRERGFPPEKLENVFHCIEAHSFSAAIPCRTAEAKVVQDADRMESLGAIGLARTFYVAGNIGSQLFDETDPFGKQRELNDKKFALDHFQTKLLKLPEKMKTQRGKKLAQKRANVLTNFLHQIEAELRVTNG